MIYEQFARNGSRRHGIHVLILSRIIWVFFPGVNLLLHYNVNILIAKKKFRKNYNNPF